MRMTVSDLLNPADDDDMFRHISHRPIGPEKALTFCGNNDRVTIGYSKGSSELEEFFPLRVLSLPSSITGDIIIRSTETDDIRIYYKRHIIRTSNMRAIVEDPVSIAVGLDPARSFPYLIAFGSEDGTVKVWSILTNSILAENESAETFVIQDQREIWKDEIISTGRFLVLAPPENLQRTDHDDGGPTTSV